MLIEDAYVVSSRFFLGLSDLNEEGIWKWIDDVPIDPAVRYLLSMTYLFGFCIIMAYILPVAI